MLIHVGLTLLWSTLIYTTRESKKKFNPKMLNSWRTTESQDNSSWREAQEVSVSNLLLKAAPAQGQSRWLRSSSSHVLKTYTDGSFTAFLGSLLRLFRVTMGKTIFLILSLNLSCRNLHLLSLICPPHTWVKSLALSAGAFIVTAPFLHTCET